MNYTYESIKEILFPIFSQHKVNKAILFGSFAKGTATPNSDIDIFVDSGLKGLSFFGLLEDISEQFAIPIDLIDSSQVISGSKIEKEILYTGKLLYEQ